MNKANQAICAILIVLAIWLLAYEGIYGGSDRTPSSDVPVPSVTVNGEKEPPGPPTPSEVQPTQKDIEWLWAHDGQDAQESKCRSDAQENYKNYVITGQGTGFSYHYQKSTGRCMLLYSWTTTLTTTRMTYFFSNMLDTGSQQMVGSYWYFHDQWGNIIVAECTVGGQPCDSSTGYQRLVAPYMEN